MFKFIGSSKILNNQREYQILDTSDLSVTKCDRAYIIDVFKKLDITKIDYLLITHYHPDHMGIAQEIIDNMNAKLLVIDIQKDYLHCSDKIFEKDKKSKFTPINTEPLIISCEESRKFLSDLGIDGEIIYTPGHSDDSISLILDDGIAIVGDLYDLNSASAFNDDKINNSWKSILSHNISKICYGHHEQMLDK